jgi:hypothetical protein
MPLKHLLWCVFIKSQRLPAKFVKIINVHHFVVVKAALATFVRKYGVLPELLPIDTGVVHVHVQYSTVVVVVALRVPSFVRAEILHSFRTTTVHVL